MKLVYYARVMTCHPHGKLILLLGISRMKGSGERNDGRARMHTERVQRHQIQMPPFKFIIDKEMFFVIGFMFRI